MAMVWDRHRNGHRGGHGDRHRGGARADFLILVEVVDLGMERVIDWDAHGRN